MTITRSNIDDVFKCKKSSIDTMELKGYKLIDNLFVDNSGWGADNEPALTQNQFINKLNLLLDEHKKLVAKITNAGQFQVYVGLFKKVGASKMQKIGNNTYKIITPNGYKIRLHDTDILTFEGDKITLESGGFNSHTTKERINKFLPNRFYLFQKNFDWFVKDNLKNEVIEFKNGLTLEI